MGIHQSKLDPIILSLYILTDRLFRSLAKLVGLSDTVHIQCTNVSDSVSLDSIFISIEYNDYYRMISSSVNRL